MGNNRNDRSVLRRIMSAAVSALCVLFALAAALSAICKFMLFNREFYVAALTSDKYVDEIYEQIKTDVKYQSAVYVLPESVPMKSITKSEVREDCAKYARRIFDCFKNNSSEVLSVAPDTEKMLSDIEEYLASDKSSALNSETARTVAVPMYSEIYSNCINAVSFGNVTKLVNKLFSNRAVGLLNSGFYLFSALYVLCIVAKFFLSSGETLKRFWTIFSTGFVSAAFVFAPLAAIKQYDLPSRLALGYSPAKSFVDCVMYSIVDKAFYFSLAAVAVFALGLTVFSAFRSAKISESPIG